MPNDLYKKAGDPKPFKPAYDAFTDDPERQEHDMARDLHSVISDNVHHAQQTARDQGYQAGGFGHNIEKSNKKEQQRVTKKYGYPKDSK